MVLCELLAIAFIRYRFMDGKLANTIVQVVIGGGIVFAIGVWLETEAFHLLRDRDPPSLQPGAPDRRCLDVDARSPP